MIGQPAAIDVRAHSELDVHSLLSATAAVGGREQRAAWRPLARPRTLRRVTVGTLHKFQEEETLPFRCDCLPPREQHEAATRALWRSAGSRDAAQNSVHYGHRRAEYGETTR